VTGRRLFGAFVGILLLGAAPAHASTSPRLTETGGHRFPDRAYALTLPTPRSLTTESVQVTENGTPVEALSILSADGANARRFGVVLAIDASTSMRGRPLEGAVTAARRFVRRRNAGQPVAVLAFAGDVKVVQPFTTDTGTLDHALISIRLAGGGTHLLDAADEAVRLLRAAHIASGSVVLLSDGGDRGSHATLERVTTAAGAAGTRVYGIGLRSARDDFGTLNLLAAGTHGEFSSATSVTDLRRIYDRLGSQLASQYVVQYRSGAPPGERVQVAIRVAGFSAAATAVYATPAVQHAARQPFRHSPADILWQSPTIAVLTCLFAALLLVLALWLLLRRRSATMQSRMAPYVSPPSEVLEPTGGQVAARALVGAGRSLDRTAWGTRFKTRLDVAGITTAPVRLCAGIVASILAVMLVFAQVGGVAFAPLAFAIPVVAWSVISQRVKRQRKLFSEQLPGNLEVIASAMRAGHSFSAALGVVVEDAPEPSRREFERVIADERVGVPLDHALQVVVERMANKDLEQVALVVALQRETGGNAAEVLDRVTETARDQLALRRMVKTLTAQGRMSRWVVTALPVGLLVLLTLINPVYMRPLFETPIGRTLLVVAGVMVVSGSLVIKRIVEIKV
jgi:tight adherence protein B